MKKLLKTSIHLGIGALLILAAQNFQSVSTPSDVYAQSGLSKYLTPEKFDQQANQNTSNSLETNTKIPYALPQDISLFNIVGSLYNGNGIGFSTYSNHIRLEPIFQDINGDGLSDLIYSAPSIRDPYDSYISKTTQYVLLNNGEGFDLVYYCLAKPSSYKGDCAATQ